MVVHILWMARIWRRVRYNHFQVTWTRALQVAILNRRALTVIGRAQRRQLVWVVASPVVFELDRV
jgi:hypothetical protein